MLDDNLGGFFGYIGKCLLTKDLFFDKLDKDHIDQLERIIDYWRSFINDFPYFLDHVQDFTKRVQDKIFGNLDTKMYLDNINDFLYFLGERDYIQLILKCILYLNNDIGRQFLDGIENIDILFKNVLTKQVVLDIIQKYLSSDIDDDLNCDYLPVDFWWRKWNLR